MPLADWMHLASSSNENSIQAQLPCIRENVRNGLKLTNADRPTKHEQMNDLPSQNYLFQWLEVFGNGQSSLKKKKEKLCQNWVFF